MVRALYQVNKKIDEFENGQSRIKRHDLNLNKVETKIIVKPAEK